jgi:hypothetical protein
MKCKKIEKNERWKNHLEALDDVCAKNKNQAQKARDKAAKKKFKSVVKAARESLASRMQCGGACQADWECKKPAAADIKVGKSTYDVEVKKIAPQPDPNGCKKNEALYNAQAVINFTLTAKCKCVKKEAGNPNLSRQEKKAKKNKKNR